MPLYRAEAESRVARGAQWLDQMCPTWPRAIHPATFNMQGLKTCPLGQIFGHYESPASMAAVPDAIVVSHGFHPGGSEIYEQDAWERLEAAWLVERARRLPAVRCVRHRSR